MSKKLFNGLQYLLNNQDKIEKISQYRLMKQCGINQSTAKKVKERVNMKLKELKFLQKVKEDINIDDPKIIPLVEYLLTDHNYFKNDSIVVNSTGFSRYLVKKAREIIEDYIKENMN